MTKRRPKKLRDNVVTSLVSATETAGSFTGADLVRLLSSLPDAPPDYLDAVAQHLGDQADAEDTRPQR